MSRGIFGDQVFGHIFINGNLTREIYLTVFQDEVVPTLALQFPDELNSTRMKHHRIAQLLFDKI